MAAHDLTNFKLLGQSGLRVSPLCLGTMTFGTEWGWGADKDVSRRMTDMYMDAGGNFIDTANLYTNGTSEKFVGEFIAEKRERVVLATKYTLNMDKTDPNAGGNHRKNLTHALEASLRRLRTDTIDLFWVHAWDQRTPVDEVMRALDDAVRQGKVQYVGISDSPAWIVSMSNVMAELRGWTRYVGLQIQYSLIERTVERDLIPMARMLNIGVTPWGALGGGLLTGKHTIETLKNQDAARPVNESRMTPKNLEIIETVYEIAKEIERKPAQVALAWLMQKPGVTSPILGARTAEQLEDNLEALRFQLSTDQIKRLNEVSAIELGFPQAFLSGESVRKMIDGDHIGPRRW